VAAGLRAASHKNCTAGCQPADVVARCSGSLPDSTTGWQPVVRFFMQRQSAQGMRIWKV